MLSVFHQYKCELQGFCTEDGSKFKHKAILHSKIKTDHQAQSVGWILNEALNILLGSKPQEITKSKQYVGSGLHLTVHTGFSIIQKYH